MIKTQFDEKLYRNYTLLITKIEFSNKSNTKCRVLKMIESGNSKGQNRETSSLSIEKNELEFKLFIAELEQEGFIIKKKQVFSGGIPHWYVLLVKEY